MTAAGATAPTLRRANLGPLADDARVEVIIASPIRIDEVAATIDSASKSRALRSRRSPAVCSRRPAARARSPTTSPTSPVRWTRPAAWLAALPDSASAQSQQAELMNREVGNFLARVRAG